MRITKISAIVTALTSLAITSGAQAQFVSGRAAIVEIVASNGQSASYGIHKNSLQSGIDKGVPYIRATNEQNVVIIFSGEQGSYTGSSILGGYQFQPTTVWVNNTKLDVVTTQKGCLTNLAIACRAQTADGTWYKITPTKN
jgi:hypothetical protein